MEDVRIFEAIEQYLPVGLVAQEEYLGAVLFFLSAHDLGNLSHSAGVVDDPRGVVG